MPKLKFDVRTYKLERTGKRSLYEQGFILESQRLIHTVSLVLPL